MAGEGNLSGHVEAADAIGMDIAWRRGLVLLGFDLRLRGSAGVFWARAPPNLNPSVRNSTYEGRIGDQGLESAGDKGLMGA